MDNEAVTDILRAFAERPIAFYPAFARLTGSVKAGVFLSQLFYWTPRGTKHRDGWIEKTLPEWLAETAMSRKEIETARARCVELELVEFKQAGLPAKTVYRLDLGKLIYRLRESRNQGCEKVATKDETFMSVLGCEKVASLSYTETTSEIRAETGAAAAPSVPDSMRSQGSPPRKPRNPRRLTVEDEPRLSDPRVGAWVDVFGTVRAPHLREVDAICERVPVDALDAWRATLTEWAGTGWRIDNIAGMVERMQRSAIQAKHASAKPSAGDKFEAALELIRGRAEVTL